MRWRSIGGKAGSAPIEALAAGRPGGHRLLAVAALARLDSPPPRRVPAEILCRPASRARNLKPLLRAFLDRQGGSELLAKAIGSHTVPPDSAKLALRAVYSLGRSDPALVEALSRAAGISRAQQAA